MTPIHVNTLQQEDKCRIYNDIRLLKQIAQSLTIRDTVHFHTKDRRSSILTF